MRGDFASCAVFSRDPQGRGKIRAMSKMSGVVNVKSSNKRFIIPLEKKGVILLQLCLVRVFFFKKMRHLSCRARVTM